MPYEQRSSSTRAARVRTRASLIAVAAGLAALGPALLHAAPRRPAPAADTSSGQEATRALERGRYLVQVTGCNDCHTPGYAAAAGRVPEQDWLIGDQLGYRGPWGTTYPTNLRLMLPGMTEEAWLTLVRQHEARPPMPWFNLRAMTEADQRALYRYVVSLGRKGAPAPTWLPPDRDPSGPVVVFPAPGRPQG